MRILRTLVLLILALIPLAQTQGQNTLNVPSTAYPTIQSAINAAVTGDTVIVAAGTYVENLVWGNQDITVMGAGVGQSIIDGNGAAPCLLMEQQTTAASTFDGFTLVNGLGAPTHNGMFFVAAGGGIYVVRSILGYPAATIRNCEVAYCIGDIASAMYIRFATTVNVENVYFHDNNQSTTAAAPNGLIGVSTTFTTASFKGCRFEGGIGNGVIGVSSDASLTLEDCVFENNLASGVLVGVSTSGDVVIRRCIFRNNVCTSPQYPSCMTVNTGGPFGTPVEIKDSLFSGNVGGIACVGADVPASSEIRNLTFVHNHLGVVGGGMIGGFTLDLSNVISWGNTDSSGAVPPFQYPSPSNVLNISNSIIEGGIAGLSSIMTANPQFVDPVQGDYRLLPGSPAVDAGSSVGVDPTDVDLDGNPRTLGLGVDIGAYESNTIAHHPCSAGRVGENQGGPFDILLINGSNGGPFRTVSVPIGSASVIQMIQPPSSAAPLDFSIFGLIGEATYDTIWNVPFGIGDMGFAPAPAAPLFQPILFTYASSVGAINGVLPLIPGSPTPWSAGTGPAIPFPLTLTFQGVVADANSVFTPTNLIIFKVE